MKYNYSREKIKWENEKILEEKLLKDNNIDQTIMILFKNILMF